VLAVAYYACALPLGIWLAYGPHQMGLQGLWVGQVLALGLVGAAEFLGVTRFTDWGHEVRKAEKRGEGSGECQGGHHLV
jgi:multidrug resistance protein, MATE family